VKTSRRRWLALLGLLPVAAASIPVLESMGQRRRPGTQRPVRGFHRDYFPDVLLRTQDGEPVRLYSDLLKGKTVLVHFFDADARDGLFPSVTENLLQLQRLLGERLKGLRASRPIAPGWTFLTGSAPDLELCRARFGIADSDPALDRAPARHTNVVLLGNEPHERWLASPALSSPAFLLEQLDRVAGVKT